MIDDAQSAVDALHKALRAESTRSTEAIDEIADKVNEDYWYEVEMKEGRKKEKTYDSIMTELESL